MTFNTIHSIAALLGMTEQRVKNAIKQLEISPVAKHRGAFIYSDRAVGHVREWLKKHERRRR